MLAIESVPVEPSSPLQAHARTLFVQYGDFLRCTQACGSFNFPRYEEETATLPAFYSEHGGEVLLVMDDGSAYPAGCIAYRANPNDSNGTTAEIKRLFIAPSFRNRSLARRLVAETLTRIRARPFSRIMLDTDPTHMPGALDLYQSFGFREYAPRQGDIAFLDLHVTPEKKWLP